MKIVETAVTETGESYIYSSNKTSIPELIPGHDFSTLFFTSTNPPDLMASCDTLQKSSLNIQPGEIRFVRSVVHPTLEIYQKIKEKYDIALEKLFYHSSSTIDYLVIQQGKLTLLVGDEKIELEAGDCVIQRGAAHAWHNYTNEPAIIVGVMVGAKVPDQFKLIKIPLAEFDHMHE